MANSVIGQKIWSMADVLWNEGVGNRDYLEQITYLLFLKMADEYSKPPYERNIGIPANCDWKTLKNKSGAELDSTYKTILDTLGKQTGMLGEIYSRAQNKIGNPAILARIITMIDSETWSALSQDVKGDIYEELLEKTTADAKAGAGQYFTPRALINAIVKCVRPKPDKTIADPCCGSGGFILASKSFIESNNSLTVTQKEFLKYKAFRGWEIEMGAYRTSLMNLFLHGISDLDKQPPIVRNDSLLNDPGERFDYILTNPPFGSKSNYTFTNDQGVQEREDTVYNRQDFWATSSNKQLNFVQHINTILKVGGTAAVVVPDNVLNAQGAGEIIRRKLLATTDLHTILRLPTGIFYAQGVKANVLFFEKKAASPNNQTKEVWIYDFRTDKHFTLKKNALKESDLDDFVKCYNPENRHERKETYSAKNPNGRFRKFSYADIIARDKANLDIKWIGTTDDLSEISLVSIVTAVRSRIDEMANSAAQLLKLADSIVEDTGDKSIKETDLQKLASTAKAKILDLAVRGQLIPQESRWEKCTLEECLKYEQPGPYIVSSTNYKPEYKTPVLTAGKSFILGNTNETQGIYTKIPAIIFDDFTTATKFVDFSFKVKSSAMKILKNVENKADIKYMYYLLQTISINSDSHRRFWISAYEPMKILLPSLPEQKRIVAKIEELFAQIDVLIGGGG